MAKTNDIDLDSILKTLDIIVKVVQAASKAIEAAEPIVYKLKDAYGFINKEAPIKYKGQNGRLVWDYILYNELTFEVAETKEKYSLGTSFSDKKTEELFNKLIEQYGV